MAASPQFSLVHSRGRFVLSYKVRSLVAVATFVGVGFLFGGIMQLVVVDEATVLKRLAPARAGRGAKE